MLFTAKLVFGCDLLCCYSGLILKINLKQLETFVWVADLGNFRHVAQRLNTTQPNISARISALEATLGEPLLDRNAVPVRLTAKGADLLVYARRVLRSMEDFLEAADESSLFDGVLRLGVTEMIVNSWLREFLLAFKQRYPDILVELTVDLSSIIETQLLERAIDLAFQSGPFKSPMPGDHDLGLYPMIWVAAPDIADKLPDKIKLDHLVAYPIITHAKVTHTYRELSEYFAKRQDLKMRLTSCGNLASSVQMTLDGFGVSPMLLPLVNDHLADGSLVKLNFNWHPTPLSFHARYEQSRASKPIIHAAQMAESISQSYLSNLQS
jgi:Transcriptional regulator